MNENQKYASTSEVAEALSVSVPRIHNLINQNRIQGAFQVGGKRRGTWLIPVDSKTGMPTVLPSKTRNRKFQKINKEM